jgi:hypothetical protein
MCRAPEQYFLMIFRPQHDDIFLSGKWRHHTKVINNFNSLFDNPLFYSFIMARNPFSAGNRVKSHFFLRRSEGLHLLEKQRQAVDF